MPLEPGSTQPNGEGYLSGDHGPSLAEEFPGAGGVAGHERVSVLGQDEDSARADAAGVRRVVRGSVTAPVGLPSPMFPAGVPRGGGMSVSRFVPAPGGVCSHGFQSRLLRKHSLVGLLTCGERSHRGTSLILGIVMTGAGHSATCVGERVTSFPKGASNANDQAVSDRLNQSMALVRAKDPESSNA